MHRTWILTTLIAFVFLPAASAKQPQGEWKSLLGQTLKGWEVYTGIPHKSLSVPGIPPSSSEHCIKGTPVGLGDPLQVFSVEMIKNKPVLRVTGQIYAGLTTLESFENYHLTLEYKWGTKKWPPRLQQKRDSGLLLHCTGKHGAFWNVWMRCLECQIQETDTGDLYTLAGTSAMVRVDSQQGQKPNYAKAGMKRAIGFGTPAFGCSRDANREIQDGWNRVDAFMLGDKGVFAVNGHVVMRINDAKNGKQADGEPLTAGRIQIQSEAAEISYRDIRLRSITSLPAGDTLPIN